MYKFRELNVDDVKQLMDINRELQQYGWSDEQLEKECNNPETIIYVVTGIIPTLILGFISIECRNDELHINNITIRKNLRGIGIGKALLKYLLDRAFNAGFRYILLNVRTDNIPAINLYNKIGFKILCLREQYYSHLSDQNAYYMQLDFIGYRQHIKDETSFEKLEVA